MTEQDRSILAALKTRSMQPQEQVIAKAAQELGMTPIRLAQQLNRLLADAEALAAEPMLVNLWRRRRDARIRQRPRARR